SAWASTSPRSAVAAKISLSVSSWFSTRKPMRPPKKKRGPSRNPAPKGCCSYSSGLRVNARIGHVADCVHRLLVADDQRRLGADLPVGGIAHGRQLLRLETAQHSQRQLVRVDD